MIIDGRKISKDAQRILVDFYLRKRRARQHLKIIKRDDCPYPDYRKWKKDPAQWERVLNHCYDLENQAHNNLEIIKRALWGID